MITIKKKGKKFAIEMLIDYPHIDDHIHEIMLELTYPIKENDENVGGSKGNHISKPQEQLVISIDEDRRLSAFRKQKEAVDKALDCCDKIDMQVLKEYFWTKHRHKTLEGIAVDVHLTRNAIYKRLNRIYINVLKNRGLYEFL